MKVVKTAVFLLFFFLIAGFGFSDGLKNRTALIIGNGSYNTARLRNPSNDAEDMAKKLRELGFTVNLLKDAGKGEIDSAVRSFAASLESKKGVGLFYYAGHGMQIDGQNYLIPVDADIDAEDEIAYKGYNVGQVLEKMESAGNPTNIVILDACRDNPFARSFRSSSRGLSVVEAPQGSLIVYATAPGNTAAEGRGRNGSGLRSNSSVSGRCRRRSGSSRRTWSVKLSVSGRKRNGSGVRKRPGEYSVKKMKPAVVKWRSLRSRSVGRRSGSGWPGTIRTFN